MAHFRQTAAVRKFTPGKIDMDELCADSCKSPSSEAQFTDVTDKQKIETLLAVHNGFFLRCVQLYYGFIKDGCSREWCS
jgi:hypothetical protein